MHRVLGVLHSPPRQAGKRIEEQRETTPPEEGWVREGTGRALGVQGRKSEESGKASGGQGGTQGGLGED